MNTRIAKILIFSFAISLSGIVGCGGDDAPALSKAEFIKQAAAICKKADDAQFKRLARAEEESEGAQAGKAAEEALLVAAVLEPIQRQAEELRELGAPEGDEEQVEAIVNGMEEAVKTGEKDGESAFTEGKDPFKEVDKLSEKYGMKPACAEAI